MLKRWGFTPQKPAFRAYEQSPEAVRRWIEREYPHIRRKAQKQGAIIHWVDEVGTRSTHQAGTTYAPRGKTSVLKKTGKRFGINLISAIANNGKMVFMIVEGPFNGVVFRAFLQKLLKSVTTKVFLIADSHPVHLQKSITAWLKEKQKRIEMFLLPTFSPELNPGEYFNQDLKTNAAGKARPKDQQELKTVVQRFANRKKNNPQKVKKYFHPNSVAYAR